MPKQASLLSRGLALRAPNLCSAPCLFVPAVSLADPASYPLPAAPQMEPHPAVAPAPAPAAGKMRAVRFDRFGPAAEVLKLTTDQPRPQRAPGEVLLTVAATSV